jgi:hypothetical protein
MFGGVPEGHVKIANTMRIIDAPTSHSCRGGHRRTLTNHPAQDAFVPRCRDEASASVMRIAHRWREMGVKRLGVLPTEGKMLYPRPSPMRLQKDGFLVPVAKSILMVLLKSCAKSA